MAIPEKIFELHGQEFIELNKMLKLLGLVETGGEANIMIESGEVTVNGEVETRKRKKLRSGENVNFAGQSIHIL
jgi:ribosome-associated protein